MSDKNNQAIDILKEFLTKEDASDKINSILSALGNGTKEDQKESDNLSKVAGLLSSAQEQKDETDDFQIAKIIQLKSAYDALNKQDDPKIKLLNALRPYLQTKRVENLESAIKILHFIRFAPLLSELKEFF